MKRGETFFWTAMLAFGLLLVVYGASGQAIVVYFVLAALMGALIAPMFFPKYKKAGPKVRSFKKANLLAIAIYKDVTVIEYSYTPNRPDREVVIKPGFYFLERKPNPKMEQEEFWFLTNTSQGMPESFWTANSEMVELR